MKLQMPEYSEDDIDMTPMIDVVFQLIIFFMVVTKTIQNDIVGLELPVAERSVMPKERKNRVTVSVTADGTLFLGARVGTKEEIIAAVQDGVARSPDFKIFLRGDEKAKHKDIKTVMEAAATGGTPNIIFASLVKPAN